ncbi:class I SAM-dependent methyltransferase [Nafulsella turpanensis]|uniref:class I SAM-dependent methyltransferase n=1 Tax=Nafulsella turpanensis TaxID=1265690 RepID=UPI00034DF885|nr:class I SAM-dependent methyltransferase [Nafulsella turpanensis]
MEEHLNQCPLCKSGHFTLYKKLKDFSVSQESFRIVSCNHCGFRFTNPRPVESELGKYYESEDYISHTNEGNNLINNLYKLARIYTIQQKSRLIGKWGKKGRLLDIGCGTGEFIDYNKKLKWTVSGVEVNDKARAQAEQLVQQPLFASLDAVTKEKQFQAITLWHVLEHISNLEESCLKIKELLAPKGMLFVAVPNSESYDAQYYQEYWAAYDVPRHLYHFTQQTMEQWWRKFDMHIQAVVPMKLDAYYVSMLSEKHKTGKPNMAKASLVGLRSNLKARTSNNYSSLIYIISK